MPTRSTSCGATASTSPPAVRLRLERGKDETPKPGDPVFAKVQNKVIATPHRSLEAAAAVFQREGVAPVILGDAITGEAAEVGKVMAALVQEIRRHGSPWKPPVALISGGECTVTIRGEGGRGGRCTEFLLSLGIETGGVWALAADTDGIDGTEDNAGAVLSPTSLKRGPRRAGAPRETRQLRLLQRARRSGQDRADPYQRQRLPRDRDHLVAVLRVNVALELDDVPGRIGDHEGLVLVRAVRKAQRWATRGT